MGSWYGVFKSFTRGSPQTKPSNPASKHMPRELTPDEIRTADLGRQFRGYHREQTEHLLAEIAEELGRVLEQRDALSRQIGDLQRAHDDRDIEAKRVAEELSARFQDRDRRAADLGAELKELREARSSELEEAQGLREELSTAQTALEQHRSELIEHREVVARLRTREKALAEQVAMLESQLGKWARRKAGSPSPGDSPRRARGSSSRASRSCR